MKIGMRKPSLKKSLKARTTGRLKRSVKRTINPFYGKKGMGFVRNPKKAIYNKVYRKPTFSPFALGKGIGGLIVGLIVLPVWLIYIVIKFPFSLLSSVFANSKGTGSSSITVGEVEFTPQRSEAQIINQNHISQSSTSIPVFQGDYAKAVFLWANSKPSPVKSDDEYQRYLLYECGIASPSNYHKSLISQGYYGASTVEERLQQLTVNEIKLILDELALPKAGKKDELIERVVQNADASVIDRYCKESYSLTELGRNFIEDHQDYINRHKAPNRQM